MKTKIENTSVLVKIDRYTVLNLTPFISKFHITGSSEFHVAINTNHTNHLERLIESGMTCDIERPGGIKMQGFVTGLLKSKNGTDIRCQLTKEWT